ncbi:recombinase family protein, partial [Klebsiella pneumoniae]|nr:recombinase family protein [Klebsiella pneumoniae]
FEPHRVITETVSGSVATDQRKGFVRLLDRLERGDVLVVTKLDGTAKGGVLAAIARERPVPVYFIGVGEQLEDLET